MVLEAGTEQLTAAARAEREAGASNLHTQVPHAALASLGGETSKQAPGPAPRRSWFPVRRGNYTQPCPAAAALPGQP